MGEAYQRDERLAKTREEDGADEGARHSAGKGEVVIGGGEAVADGIVGVAGAGEGDGGAINEDVMRSLEVE